MNSKEKNQLSTISLCLPICIGVGAAAGAAFNDLPVWIACGVATGFVMVSFGILIIKIKNKFFS